MECMPCDERFRLLGQPHKIPFISNGVVVIKRDKVVAHVRPFFAFQFFFNSMMLISLSTAQTKASSNVVNVEIESPGNGDLRTVRLAGCL